LKSNWDWCSSKEAAKRDRVPLAGLRKGMLNYSSLLLEKSILVLNF